LTPPSSALYQHSRTELTEVHVAKQGGDRGGLCTLNAEVKSMAVSDRFQRASFYAFVTASVVGLVLLMVTISPLIRPGYMRTAAFALVASYAILVFLIAIWYWVLKLLGK
jgi:hypothetical protein